MKKRDSDHEKRNTWKMFEIGKMRCYMSSLLFALNGIASFHSFAMTAYWRLFLFLDPLVGFGGW